MAQSYITARVAAHYPSLEPGYIDWCLAARTFVSLEHKYLYCEVPKAGCTLLKSIIHTAERLPAIDISRSLFPETRRDLFVHDRALFRMPSLVDLPNATQELVINDPGFFRFTAVRNPYRRLESAWKEKVLLCAPGYEDMVREIKGALPRGNVASSLVTYPEFVEAVARQDLVMCDHHWKLQTINIFHPALNLDHIGRLENIDATVEAYLRWVGRPDLTRSARKMNASAGSVTYTPDLAKRVYDLYKADFKAFDYAADSWRAEETAKNAGFVPESKYIDELLERNIMLGTLYKQRKELATSLAIKPPDYVAAYRKLSFDELYDRHILPIDGATEKAEARLLYESARSVTQGCIVTTGAYRGRPVSALAFGAIAGTHPEIFAVSPCDDVRHTRGKKNEPHDRGYLMRTLVELGLFHIVRLVDLASESLGGQWPSPVSLLCIGGERDYESVVKEFKHWWPHLVEGGLLVVEDSADPRGGPGRFVAEMLASGDVSHVASADKTIALRRNASSA